MGVHTRLCIHCTNDAPCCAVLCYVFCGGACCAPPCCAVQDYTLTAAMKLTAHRAVLCCVFLSWCTLCCAVLCRTTL